MSAPSPNGQFSLGSDILGSTRDAETGAILLNIGDVASEQTESDRVELWQTPGIVSRPSTPTPKQQAAQAIVIKTGDHDVAIATKDQRSLDLGGQLQPGETCVFGGGEDGQAQGRLMIKADGSVVLYTAKGNVEGGTSITIQALADGSINIASEFGGVAIGSAGVKVVTASGSGAQFNSNGVTLIGQAVQCNGAAVSLGAGAGTGVAVQSGLEATLKSLVALTAALQGFFNFPAVTALAGGTAEPCKGAAAALGVLAALPTNFSTSVKAAP